MPRRPTPIEIQATWVKERWRPRESDDPENHFVIALAELPESGESITLLGDAPRGTMLMGVKYRFLGRWEENEKFGRQFRFEQHSPVGANTRHGVVQYLDRYCSGIGPATAGALFDEFGSDAIKMLRTNPEEAARRVKLLRVEVAAKAAGVLQAQAELEDIRIGLCDLFAGRGFPRLLVDLCLDKWKILAVDRIRRDPWCLLVEGFSGCGFDRVDRLYSDLGLPKEQLKRQMICLWHVMKKDSSGHTWHDKKQMVRAMEQKVEAECQPDRAIELGVRAGWIAAESFEGVEYLAVAERARNEGELAEIIGGMF